VAGSKFRPQVRRLLFIDAEIRKGGFPNCSALGRAWEVSYKTIRRDVEYLRDQMGAPIEYDAARHGYAYADRNWYLPSVSLSEGDLLAMLLGAQALAAYEGTPVAGELQGIFTRLAGLLPDTISLPPELVFERFSFAGPPSRPVDVVVWKAVVRGVMHRRELEITYRSAGGPAPRRRRLRPLHVANIEGDWYVLAVEEGRSGVRQFALSRIRDAEVTDAPFEPPRGFSARSLLEHRVGKFVVGHGRAEQPVRLLFRADTAGTIRERRWHRRQRIEPRRDGALVLTLPVSDARILVPWVLGFGDAVRVLGPAALRREVAAALRAAAAQYGDRGSAAKGRKAVLRGIPKRGRAERSSRGADDPVCADRETGRPAVCPASADKPRRAAMRPPQNRPRKNGCGDGSVC
jgi:proteasome accessory factor B